ncbi:rod shape-determining protein MreC [Clostridium sp. DL-VIII]|uniref:rod shape-determining protein MreC n=1 Tax=Clostridium sp. DL-VIII TaxID=641107 RepID=UPI00023B05EF|nr:rod shape-determining protein MreC [Clostridium sp. DL-VIII]EHJ02024.1 rod shape-determining protein MreC [Clostridium sp. DL-VIII]
MKLLRNKLAVTIIVLSVSFLGLIVYSAKRENRSIIESGAGSTLNPVQSILYSGTNRVKETLDFFLNFSEVKAQNKELTDQNAELENELTSYANLKEENDRLRQVLNFEQERNNYNYIACNIKGYSGGNFLDGYIVDKGKKDNVQKGMIVIGAEGLVGQVTSVDDSTCIIQSLLNENISVGVMVQRTNDVTGYIKGFKDKQNGNLAKVYDLPMDSDVKEGDVITTSGVGMLYPKDIRIGEVIRVEEDSVKVMKNAVVKPYVDFNKLQELFIVSPKDTKEIKYN